MTGRYQAKISKFDIVAAIDIGTSSSGYAYSSVTEFDRSPLNIISEQCWNKYGMCKDDTERKTASCILLDKDENFVSFGYDAQHIFADYQSKKKDGNFALFQHFKMNLYEQKGPRKDVMIADISGVVNISAEKIFMYAIKAISDALMEQMSGHGQYKGVGKEDIRWVITVPAIWDDRNKLFMTKCALMAGLQPEQVLIALEPEAASIFCNCLKTNRPENITEGFDAPTVGTKYIVVDLGGGTTDITVHEKLKNGMLKEIGKSSGKGIGGSTVDKAFIEMMHKKLTVPVCTLLRKKNPVAYLDLRKDLEEAKKSVIAEESDLFEIPINYRVINSISKEQFNSSISYNISDKIVDEHLQVPDATVKELFKPTTEEILEAVKNALEFDVYNEVSMIILVGGFANCEIIEIAIKNRFKPRRVIVPADAGSAVLQGAVLYGHNPDVISNRIMKYTYGVGAQVPFNENIHDQSRKFVQNEKPFCGKLFDIIVKRDQSVPSGTFISRSYVITRKSNQHISSLYSSESLNPMYTDEAKCLKVGTLKITFPNTKDTNRILDVHFLFGGTQLTFQASDRESGLEFETTVSVD